LSKESTVDSEIVFGIISPIGTDTKDAIEQLKDHIRKFRYRVEEIKVSSDIISLFDDNERYYKHEGQRIKHYMDLGNKVRESADNAILMKGVSSIIHKKRNDEVGLAPRNRVAYVINSIKHPDEIKFLRNTYGVGFHLIGISSTVEMRRSYLVDQKKPSSYHRPLASLLGIGLHKDG